MCIENPNTSFITAKEHEYFGEVLRYIKQRMTETIPECQTDKELEQTKECHVIQNIMDLKDNLSNIARDVLPRLENNEINIDNLYFGDNPPRK